MDLTPEDRVVVELLDRLNRDGDVYWNEAAPVRDYVELLALLPYELEPVAPPSGVWHRIEARLGDAAPAAAVGSAPAAAGRSKNHTLVPFPRRPTAAHEPLGDAGRAAAPPARQPAAWGSVAMAAALGACLLGLGYLLARTEFQQSTIDQLRSDLVVAESVASEVSQGLHRIEDRYLMVTRTARQYYPMRPVVRPTDRPPVYGRVWVCGQHQQWLLNVEGLQPAPSGYEYRFWFETPKGKVAGGVVELRQGRAHLEAPSMPVGTTGFSVTLERLGVQDEPAGQELLRGEQALEILGGINDRDLDREALSM